VHLLKRRELSYGRWLSIFPRKIDSAFVVSIDTKPSNAVGDLTGNTSEWKRPIRLRELAYPGIQL
jgi:hypothetical protein